MRAWKQRLEGLGEVRLFDYDYMREGRKRPDPLPLLIAAHRAALSDFRRSSASAPIFLAGKSMGGRIGCHVSLTEKIDGLICFGYPLCGGGDPTKMRDQVLRELTTPILFLQGTRDPLCPLDLLENVRQKMTAPNTLHLVEDGDHSLRVPKRSAQLQEEVDAEILRAIAGFIGGEQATG